MKKPIYILILLLIFCNYPILGVSAQSGYNVYSYKGFSPSKINTEEEKIIFLVDFSNSMNEYLGNKRKIEVALRALYEILPKIPKSAQIGLRIYGHRGGVTPIDACMASKLVVPIDANNFKKIYRELERIAPIGMTPITYSIKQSLKNDFGLWQGKKRIIVLTDGGETCDESPCSYALKIIQERNDVQIDVIAFSVNDINAMDQLKCAALVTNGKFYNADTYANLVNSLNDSFKTEKSVEGVIIEK
ncbi:VWA domain-containing protein [bacterium]|nr:VWA domain-containing protein [bacterium]